MLSLYGSKEAIKNVYLLGFPYLEKKEGVTTDDLRQGYLKFLNKHQPAAVTPLTDSVFVTDPEAEEIFKTAYSASSLNDLNQNDMIGDALPVGERDQLLSVVKEGYEILCKANPELKVVFDTVIRGIFFRKSKKSSESKPSFGGSSSTAIGVIWLSGQANPTARDFAELLLHELTHHLLFIDERCRAQFHYENMVLPENYSRSALLKKHRPLDKVVHSIVVATEVLLARKSFLGEYPVIVHPDTESLRASTLQSINEVLNLENRDKVITPWTKEILEKCLAKLQ